MKILHDHPRFLPEQRKSLLCEVHRSCRADLLRNMSRQMGNTNAYSVCSKALER
jgi:hypothetical protein